jgi:hypothetical protein
MPSRPAVRADDKRLATPGKKKRLDKHGNGERTRMELYEAGLLKVADMDDKELEKGWFRNASGGFKGGRPKQVPRKFADELHAERIRRWNKKVEEELDASLQALKDIRDNPRAPADARHKSAVYLIERAVGKVPERNEVKVEMAPWEEKIAGILVDDDSEED